MHRESRTACEFEPHLAAIYDVFFHVTFRNMSQKLFIFLSAMVKAFVILYYSKKILIEWC